MCNVQKEVGITMAYALMAGSLKGEMQRQSMSHAISQLLHKLKVKTIENMFKADGRYMNTHPLLAYQNGLSEHVGLDFVHDEHQTPENATPERIKTFFEKYNFETCVEVVNLAINEKPRKIPYDTTMRWLEEHVPSGYEKYDYLMEVFDEDGKVKSPHIIDMLLSERILEEDDGTEPNPKPEESKTKGDDLTNLKMPEAAPPLPVEIKKARRLKKKQLNFQPALLKKPAVPAAKVEKPEEPKKKLRNPFRRKKKDMKNDLAKRPPWANANHYIRPEDGAVPIGKPVVAKASIRERMKVFENAQNNNGILVDRKPPPPLKNLW
jgi:hypothetical protein